MTANGAKITAMVNWLNATLLPLFFLALVTGCSQSSNPADQSKEWRFTSQRAEIAPGYWVEETILFDGKPTLALSGDGKFYVNGAWSRTFSVEPGSSYEFKTHYQQKNVDEPGRCILATISWLDENGDHVERQINTSVTKKRDYSREEESGATTSMPDFPVTLDKTVEGWHVIQQTCKAPDNAVKAKIDLMYRWSADGLVYFGGTTFNKVPPLKPRLVRLAAVHHRPQNSKSSRENLDQFAALIKIAAEKNADIVCLPEAITSVGTGISNVAVSEPVPGPTTEFLGGIAKELNIYIVGCLFERDGPVVYNTAFLLDRNGQVQGKYRKVSLPFEEIIAGVTPGDSLPVFDTDFGRIGLMICWDVFFPEPARMLALKGAEVIFMPIWGGHLTLAKARAIENQVYLVSSTYDMKTGVFDQGGELLVEGTDENPVAVVEVDLNKQRLWKWLGEFKNRIPRELPSRKAVQY